MGSHILAAAADILLQAETKILYEFSGPCYAFISLFLIVMYFFLAVIMKVMTTTREIFENSSCFCVPFLQLIESVPHIKIYLLTLLVTELL